jgi:hypothetical protein
MFTLWFALQEFVEPEPSLMQRLYNFLDTPAPYSPFTEYLLIMFLLWLMTRRTQRIKSDFSGQAQEVLEQMYKKGEIDEKTYEKYRQELSMRLKKE